MKQIKQNFFGRWESDFNICKSQLMIGEFLALFFKSVQEKSVYN